MSVPAPVLAFDMFGTLADPASFAEGLRPHVEAPAALADAWRHHQLEVSWLLSLAGHYENWSRVTAYALDTALEEAGVRIGEDARDAALARAAAPALYDDVAGALPVLRSRGFTLAVFSNGTATGLAHILARNGISNQFTAVVSCDEVGTYKPAPATYHHAAARLGRSTSEVWLVSGNAFDCAGAALAGMRVAKVARRPSANYPFAPQPDTVVAGLAELPDVLPHPGVR